MSRRRNPFNCDMREKQPWEVGAVVRVGFLRLRCVEPIADRPGGWILESLDGAKRYRFLPHQGVQLLP